jgi:hypothetical protein
MAVIRTNIEKDTYKLQRLRRGQITPSLAPPASFQCRNLNTTHGKRKNASSTRPCTIPHTTQFHAQCSFQLAEDLGIRDGFAGLVVLDDRRLLVDLLCEIFLRELLLHTGGLNSL